MLSDAEYARQLQDNLTPTGAARSQLRRGRGRRRGRREGGELHVDTSSLVMVAMETGESWVYIAYTCTCTCILGACSCVHVQCTCTLYMYRIRSNYASL